MGATWGLHVELGHKRATLCTIPQKINGGFLDVSWGLPINPILTTWGLPLPFKTMEASWGLPKQIKDNDGGYLCKMKPWGLPNKLETMGATFSK